MDESTVWRLVEYTASEYWRRRGGGPHRPELDARRWAADEAFRRWESMVVTPGGAP